MYLLSKTNLNKIFMRILIFVLIFSLIFAFCSNFVRAYANYENNMARFIDIKIEKIDDSPGFKSTIVSNELVTNKVDNDVTKVPTYSLNEIRCKIINEQGKIVEERYFMNPVCVNFESLSEKNMPIDDETLQVDIMSNVDENYEMKNQLYEREGHIGVVVNNSSELDSIVIEVRGNDGVFYNIGKFNIKPSVGEKVANIMPALAPEVDDGKLVKILYNGDDSNKLVLAFLADGYTMSEQDKFIDDVKKLIKGIMTTKPFSDFIKNINIYAIKQESKESGVSKAASKKNDNNKNYDIKNKAKTTVNTNSGFEIKKDTAFGSTMNYNGEERAIVPTKKENVYSVLRKYVPAYDAGIVLANSEKYGGTSSDVITITACKRSSDVLLHELGHLLGGLADEYVGGQNVEKANCTKENSPEKVKWKKYLNKDGVGIYPLQGTKEGKENGWYRPSTKCKMANLDSDFCPVCKDVLTLRLINETKKSDIGEKKGKEAQETKAIDTKAKNKKSANGNKDSLLLDISICIGSGKTSVGSGKISIYIGLRSIEKMKPNNNVDTGKDYSNGNPKDSLNNKDNSMGIKVASEKFGASCGSFVLNIVIRGVSELVNEQLNNSTLVGDYRIDNISDAKELITSNKTSGQLVITGNSKFLGDLDAKCETNVIGTEKKEDTISGLNTAARNFGNGCGVTLMNNILDGATEIAGVKKETKNSDEKETVEKGTICIVGTGNMDSNKALYNETENKSADQQKSDNLSVTNEKNKINDNLDMKQGVQNSQSSIQTINNENIENKSGVSANNMIASNNQSINGDISNGPGESYGGPIQNIDVQKLLSETNLNSQNSVNKEVQVETLNNSKVTENAESITPNISNPADILNQAEKTKVENTDLSGIQKNNTENNTTVFPPQIASMQSYIQPMQEKDNNNVDNNLVMPGENNNEVIENSNLGVNEENPIIDNVMLDNNTPVPPENEKSQSLLERIFSFFR